jgi:hypothetical protein
VDQGVRGAHEGEEEEVTVYLAAEHGMVEGQGTEGEPGS